MGARAGTADTAAVADRCYCQAPMMPPISTQ